MASQRLYYMQNNPNLERWNFVQRPGDYIQSSTSFYQDNVDRFGILTPLKGDLAEANNEVVCVPQTTEERPGSGFIPVPPIIVVSFP